MSSLDWKYTICGAKDQESLEKYGSDVALRADNLKEAVDIAKKFIKPDESEADACGYVQIISTRTGECVRDFFK